MRVFLSHLGEAAFQGTRELTVDEPNLRSVLREVERRLPGSMALLCDEKNGQWTLKPHVSVYTNVTKSDDQTAIYDTDVTEELRSSHMDKSLSGVSTLLISVFNPVRFGEKLSELLMSDNVPTFEYHDENGKSYTREFRSYLSEIKGPIEEPIFKFREGEVSLSSLATDGTIQFACNPNATDSYSAFDRQASKILPRQLVNALQHLWDLDSDKARLRRFQEDCLFFILGKLREPDALKGEALLLSIPTGGGKTEAFTIPLIAHVADQKQLGYIEPRVRAVITYPTKALANDQARRLIEIIHQVNQSIVDPNHMISIGILTGDTPKRYAKRDMLVNLCPNCHQATLEFQPDPTQPKIEKIAVCRTCNESMPYFRITRKDVLESPPDILITNPDMINYCLQDSQYHRLFEQGIDVMVFDEVHLCDGIFGCNVAHLLRRMEEASGGLKPLYVGISATISNAKTLASLIFDEDEARVEYLNDLDRFVDKSKVERYRYHFCAVPKKYRSGTGHDRYMRVLTSVLNTVDMLGHAVRDPHFRKTLVFANFRQDADHIAQYLLDQEDHFYQRYHENIHAKMQTTKQLSKAEAGITSQVGHWYEAISRGGHLHEGTLEVGWHRGGLEQEERLRAVTRFVLTHPIEVDYEMETPVDTVIATQTLELGIDIGDVTTVINSSAPHTKNEYVQRVGRGGRRKSAIALTVIDPGYPLDYYFYNRFEEMLSSSGGFEDAPIIVTNRSIRESHLLARIVDWWAKVAPSKNGRIVIKRVKALRITDEDNQEVSLADIDAYARALLHRLFLSSIRLHDGAEVSRLERLNRWFAKESDLLGVQRYRLDEDELLGLIRGKIAELWRNIDQHVYKDEDSVNGLGAVDKQLTPSMRGVGMMVGLWAVRGTGKPESKDAVSRTRAVNSMPPHAFSTMGASTFTVTSIHRADADAQQKVFNMLGTYPESLQYFREQFGAEFPSQGGNLGAEITINVPKEYLVEYRPNRFYCPRCGRTYLHLPFDERCEGPDCRAELRQLTQFYQCQKCGELYDPPVPRVCPNPNCIASKKAFIAEFRRPRSAPKYNEFFRFTALPQLTWRCRDCGTTFSYHDPSVFSSYKGRNLWEYLKDVDPKWDDPGPEDIAKTYLYTPESKVVARARYDELNLNRAQWRCSKAGCGGKIAVRNVPVVRSAVVDFIAKTSQLSQPLTSPQAHVDFHNVTIAALAKEYFYRFYDPVKEESVNRPPQEIFGPRQFLGNIYDTHAAFVKFGQQLDAFVGTIDCWNRDTGEIKCGHCPYVRQVVSPEAMQPTPVPPAWEVDSNTGQPRRPAPWGKWDFGESRADRTEFFRFVLIHTLKHGLLLGMPKYVGVSTSEVAGRVYPNGQREHDIVVLDSKEDGSGSIFLVRSNWDQIWGLSRAMVSQALAGEGSLFLEYGCQHRNTNLCPALASWYYTYLDEGKLPPPVPEE